VTEVLSSATGPTNPWQTATVSAVRAETATAKTFVLDLGQPAQYLAGQHFIVRLTAPDGYRAQRSYSVASAPDGGPIIELTIERLPGGEVSTFLHDEVVPGDELEVRGPIGGWFVWRGDVPAVLIGGGSGVVPLMAMLRLARRTGFQRDVHLLLSVRSPGDLYYAGELNEPDSTVVYTRTAPPGDSRPAGHLAASDLPASLSVGTVAYICGSTGFVDHATELITGAGVPVEMVRTERFGPSG
jgi:ferredoxin-NADP reductase